MSRYKHIAYIVKYKLVITATALLAYISIRTASTIHMNTSTETMPAMIFAECVISAWFISTMLAVVCAYYLLKMWRIYNE